MADSSPVGHEGNPKLSDPLTVSGGSLHSDATLTISVPFVQGPPLIPPPSEEGACPDCQSFTSSVLDQEAIDDCATEAGDGIVTTPGSCQAFDDFIYVGACVDICTNFYGVFTFGANSANEANVAVPAYYDTEPSLWIPPSGYVVCNSSCPGVTTRELRFDFRAVTGSGNRDFLNVTPATFQSAVLEPIQAEPAHFIECDEYTPPAGAPSASIYYSHVTAKYVEESGGPIVGVAMITDDGTNPSITGYGLLIDRPASKAKFVVWDNVIPANYVLIDEVEYDPVEDDILTLEPRMECPPDCDESNVYPITGKVRAALSGSLSWEVFSTDESLTLAEWQAMGYAALVALPNASGCFNTLTLKRVTTRMFTSHEACP